MKQSDVWIGTYTGRRFHPFAPRVEDVALEDIAHSLAHQCRYNGHCRVFYSVAEHSIHLAGQMPDPLALLGLMHDAGEAYVSDIVRPIKPYLAIHSGPERNSFKRIEKDILRVIAYRFDLPWPVPAAIEAADLRMLATERLRLFDDRMPAWEDIAGVEPYPIGLPCWEPEDVAWRFHKRFAELGGIL